MSQVRKGRNSLLTLEVHNMFVRAISDGESFIAASAAIGISRVTVWRWLRAGQEGKNERCVALYRAVRQAQATAILSRIQ